MFDFTSLAILKNASKAAIEALDNKDRAVLVSLPVRQVEKLKQALFSSNEPSYEVVTTACNVMTYAQLVQFFISSEKISVEGLNAYFVYLESSISNDSITLKARLRYLIHSVYFSDVFTDSKL